MCMMPRDLPFRALVEDTEDPIPMYEPEPAPPAEVPGYYDDPEEPEDGIESDPGGDL